jgi:hypothetical protein
MRQLHNVVTRPQSANCEARDLAGRQRIELLIDEMMEQSVPTSDPPARGVISSRFEQAMRSLLRAQPALPLTAFERGLP